jgi:hypothetical protein
MLEIPRMSLSGRVVICAVIAGATDAYAGATVTFAQIGRDGPVSVVHCQGSRCEGPVTIRTADGAKLQYDSAAVETIGQVLIAFMPSPGSKSPMLAYRPNSPLAITIDKDGQGSATVPLNASVANRYANKNPLILNPVEAQALPAFATIHVSVSMPRNR